MTDVLFKEPGDGLVWVEEIEHFIPIRLEFLVKEIEAERNHPQFKAHRHGSRSTRNYGCLGPLCRKALRDWARNARREQMGRTGKAPRTYTRDPIIKEIDRVLDEYMKQMSPFGVL